MKLLVLVVLTLFVLAVDSLTSWFDPIKDRVSQLALPFQWVTDIPRRIGEWGDSSLVSRIEIEEENAFLRQELLVYKGQLQRMAAVSAENTRLRNLLSATEMLSDKVLVTELIGVSPDPLKHSIVINRGKENNAYVGQPVLDARGLMGQITSVREKNSEVLLITDDRHALPVQVMRNGVRAIAEGTGDFRRLQLRYVSPTVDITEGDVLVSSGLGGRFPSGYPVGTVIGVHRDPGQPFMTVDVEPTASIERSRHFLLVFSEFKEFQEGGQGLLSVEEKDSVEDEGEDKNENIPQAETPEKNVGTGIGDES